MKLIKLNNEPICIEFRDYKLPKEINLEPCFEWNGDVIYLKDCIRTQNPWDFDMNLPKFIHGYFPNYPNNLLLEIVGGFALNIYKIVD